MKLTDILVWCVASVDHPEREGRPVAEFPEENDHLVLQIIAHVMSVEENRVKGFS